MKTTIEHKFDINQKVFFMENNTVNSGVIEEIFITIRGHRNMNDYIPTVEKEIFPIVYKVESDMTGDSRSRSEKNLFASKEELLNSL